MPAPDGVKVKLDKVRRLRYNTKALRRLDREHNYPTVVLMNKLAVGSVDAIVCTLWAGLLHESPGLSVDDVEEMVPELTDMEGLAEVILEALQEAMPSQNGEDPKAKGAKGKAKAATPSTS